MLVVLLGGGIGAILRYLISGILNKKYMPWGTFVVNVLGCFIFGIFVSFLSDPYNKLLLMTGFCGGFTTFSTFASETAHLFTGSKKDFIQGVTYLTSSVVLGVFAMLLGMKFISFFA